MLLHQLHSNKNNIKFKKQPKFSLPPTCDSIVRNLISNPRRHLRLISKANKNNHFTESSHNSIKIKKMDNQLIKEFSVSIQQQTHKWQAKKLVEFLKEVDTFSANVDGFYTMQPIVIESKGYDDMGWSLIDGQQRISNIYMILKYLESNKHLFNTCKNSSDLLNKYFLDTVNYENWDKFLQNKQGENTPLNENLSKVYQILHNWFSKKTVVEQEIWKKKLLNHTKFIWYVTEDESYESEKLLKTDGVGIEAKHLS